MVKRSIIALALLTAGLSASAQGLKLFSPEMHDAASYPLQVVMDFIERYFGQELPSQRQTTLEHKMADDKVYFRKGSISDLSQINDTMPFSISLFDRYYEVQWQKQEEPFVTIVFPAQYDLLLGKQKDEALNTLKESILAAPARSQNVAVCDSLTMLDDSIWQSKTEHFELEKYGPQFENHERFPKRTNTEFVQVLSRTEANMRVWERGSGETWACGTGACAVAVAACENGYCKKGEDITIKLRGGDLVINYTDDTVYMTGEATRIFDGEIEI